MSLTELAIADQERLRQTAEMLLEARRTLNTIDELPEELRPRSVEEAYFVQDAMAAALGTIGGWKIGGPAPDQLAYAPMPLLGGFAQSGDVLGESYRRLRGLEAEIAFRIGKDLPPRATPYSRAEILAAIESCHPAIEILESAFTAPDKVDKLSTNADLQVNGGFAYGAAVADWQSYDFATEGAEMIVDGAVRVSRRGSNSAGPDLVHEVEYLANECSARSGGLKAGQWITTGSWTGKTYARAGSEATARFEHFGALTIRFA